MIVIVAPYSPNNEGGNAHLGAARKIETIIKILTRLGMSVTLVNSAHNSVNRRDFGTNICEIDGLEIREITLPQYSRRPLGKLLNLFQIEQAIDAIRKAGEPKLFWFYNGYAFEMLFASRAKKLFGKPMVIEFEDWHFSRSRGLNPKPYIDYFCWRRALKTFSAAFAVNDFLRIETEKRCSAPVRLLPGLVPDELITFARESFPFASREGKLSIGYFGGLSVEKGAEVVLEVARKISEGHVIHVTGAGPLECKFQRLAKENPGSLIYHGLISSRDMYSVIAKCDVILNPHQEIEKMGDGVFPFKVIEAVASGRVLISTALPSSGMKQYLKGVQFVRQDANAFLHAIYDARTFYERNSQSIIECANRAASDFGEESLLREILTLIRKND